MDRPAELERALGVSFADKGLLRQALTHSSYVHENPDVHENPGSAAVSNDRLEFLGDALVGLVTARHLYGAFPEADEGRLTVMRSEIVKSRSLAEVAASLDLGRYLLLGKGEEAGGGRTRESNLAAAFEALAGAMLVDRGYDAARELVLKSLGPKMERSVAQSVPENSKSLLQEVVQSTGAGPPTYRIIEESGAEHERRFTAEVVVAGRVAGRGSGLRKGLAEQEAARTALESMGRDP
jgi:ribonuclease-3